MHQGNPIPDLYLIFSLDAQDVHTAEEAVNLIEVEYDVLEPVLTAPEAMAKTAPILHSDLTTDEFGNSNVADHFQHKMGDIDKGFAEADVVVEREFNTATVHQGYIEPCNVTLIV